MLESHLHDISNALHTLMDQLLPQPNQQKEENLLHAMRYSCLSSGKRLRPFLTIISSSLFGVSRSTALYTASAIEMVHAYSLIHDDLPALDNDDMRRGQPSCHKQFGEATAILAGNALLTLAFEILSQESTHADPLVRCELISSLAKAVGASGMIAGQIIDLNHSNNILLINDITRLQQLKTGALFAISCEAGAILGKGARNLRNALRFYAHDIGLAFQITDDLLDEKEEKNAQGEVANYVTILGSEEARARARILAHQAIEHLEVFDERADPLRELAHYISERV